jgi:hypothetical protein
VKAALALMLLVFLLVAAPAAGEEKPGEGLEEILGGFEVKEKKTPAPYEETEQAPGPLRAELTGSATIGASYNYAHQAPPPGGTDHRGLSRLRPELELKLRYRLSEKWQARMGARGFYDLAYSINGRSGYTREVLDEYENEAELGETYIQGTVSGAMDIKIGRQVVVWGKSDTIRVTDVLNPLDNREPGLVDIEDLRLPLWMTRAGYYLGSWNLTGIAVHEVRFNKDPVFGSDFYPFHAPQPPEDMPGGTEYALSLNGILTGWDISFYWPRIYDDRPHAGLSDGMTRLRHSRLTMLGAAANLAAGNWLLKSEAAWFDGLEFFSTPGKKKSRLDLLAGFEYSGFTDTTLALEAANRHLNGFQSSMEAPPDFAQEDEFQWALRYQRDFMHDTLHATALALFFGPHGEDGAFERLSLKYDISDSFSITGGIVNYRSGDLVFFRGIGDNDRLFFEARHSF